MDRSFDRAAPAWLAEIDHTGDVGITVTAPTLEELFMRAAYGMFTVLADVDEVEARETRRVNVEADDRQALLVEWLTELNFIHSADYMLFSNFTIDHLSDLQLAAAAQGEPVDLERHTVYTEIKAVTYHELKIEQTADRWQVQVIFDM